MDKQLESGSCQQQRANVEQLSPARFELSTFANPHLFPLKSEQQKSDRSTFRSSTGMPFNSDDREQNVQHHLFSDRPQAGGIDYVPSTRESRDGSTVAPGASYSYSDGEV
jgi:hypothetical protein